jgi:DnaJ-class molecular chaperone
MVKLDYDRDYYADLELPPLADAAEVKKQFKKLGELSLHVVRVLFCC